LAPVTQAESTIAPSNLLCKRWLALFFTALSLPLSVPVMLATSLGILLVSPGPLFFIKTVVGPVPKSIKNQGIHEGRCVLGLESWGMGCEQGTRLQKGGNTFKNATKQEQILNFQFLILHF
jgi:hypothetical protein